MYGTGIVEPEVMVAISPKVSGRLIELHADEGDRVTEGTVLARLEARDLAATVAEWQSRVQLGEAEPIGAPAFVLCDFAAELRPCARENGAFQQGGEQQLPRPPANGTKERWPAGARRYGRASPARAR